MDNPAALKLIERRYADVHGAAPNLGFPAWCFQGRSGIVGAALGFQRAHHGRLFLEAYLDAPVETYLSPLFGTVVDRKNIVEIGSMAANTAQAMIALWTRAANDLSSEADIAVAVLTAPLRSMFRRLGLILHELAPACADRLGNAASQWGSYYDLDPIVCAGRIIEGQARLARQRPA